jgi:hypothetical protein
MRRSNTRATLADVVAGVADGKSLGGRDGTEGLTTLWVAEDNNYSLLAMRYDPVGGIFCELEFDGRTYQRRRERRL